MNCRQTDLLLETGEGMTITNVTLRINDWLEELGLQNGMLCVTSQHTTTALAINEYEERLLEDIEHFFARLVPAGNAYKHNDIHLRDCPPDEPENAHSHLIAMLLGSSETIPVVNGELKLGQWQSVLFFDLDGPRQRTLSLQFLGE